MEQNSVPFKDKAYILKRQQIKANKGNRGKVSKEAKASRNDPHNKKNLFYQVDAGPSSLPKKRYCDITGFETNYCDKESGLYFENLAIYQYMKTMPKSVKDQLLAMRKALKTNPV